MGLLQDLVKGVPEFVVSLSFFILVSLYPLYDITKRLSRRIDTKITKLSQRAFLMASLIWFTPWIVLGGLFVFGINEIMLILWILATSFWFALWYRWYTGLSKKG